MVEKLELLLLLIFCVSTFKVVIGWVSYTLNRIIWGLNGLNKVYRLWPIIINSNLFNLAFDFDLDFVTIFLRRLG